ncbi:MAG TPA: oligosaccharide flippase family protein [Bryobacteraceae bacterium]|nr:oligosaccharide flippase family protein [Bryobacteraceae bacterium]
MLNTTHKSSLKALAIKGSIWTLAGHGGVLLIRMVRSLVMTRLLFPEVYGLMTLVWAVLTGLQMFADTGIGTTIIRDQRGDDPEFLNTAFTTNVFRGVLLWVVSCLIAYPMAVIYHQPALAELLPVTGLTALVHGFVSTAMYTRRRHMDFKRLAILDLSTETVTFALLVIWAYFHRSVWPLVGGAVVGQIFLVLASHLYLPGIRNKFRWDRSALHTFMGFGKWIYLSSVVYFLSTQSDRFLLGRYLDMIQLGVYGTATVLSGAIQTVVLKINSDVLFPAYSRVVQQGTGRLRQVMLRTRFATDVGMMLPIAAIMVLGSRIVGLLYDPRYHDAGWMLQVLSVRLLLVATLSNSESCLIALGHPKYALMENSFRAGAMFVAIPIGWSLYGVKGVIWAVAVSEIPPLIVIWIGMIKHRMFSLVAESRSLLFAGLGVALGLGVLHLWH